MKEGVRQVGSRVVQTKLRLLGISAIMEKYMQVLFPPLTSSDPCPDLASHGFLQGFCVH